METKSGLASPMDMRFEVIGMLCLLISSDREREKELAGVDVDPESQEEDGYEAEEDDGVDGDRGATHPHASESQQLPLCRPAGCN